MKKYLLTFTALLTASVSYALDCATPPSCSSLGYTKSAADCNGLDTVKCPFDLTQVFCFEKAETTVSCADQGYTSGTALCLIYQDKETCPTDSNYFKCVDNATKINDYCTNLGFTKPGLVSCASGYTWSSCVADSSYTKCTATSSVKTCAEQGYFLSSSSEACDCTFGHLSAGVTGSDGDCYKCGSQSECGGGTDASGNTSLYKCFQCAPDALT